MRNKINNVPITDTTTVKERTYGIDLVETGHFQSKYSLQKSGIDVETGHLQPMNSSQKSSPWKGFRGGLKSLVPKIFLILYLATFSIPSLNANQAKTTTTTETKPPTEFKETPQLIDLNINPNYLQIAIEAMIVEVNQDRSRDIGISYTYNRNEITNPSSDLEAIDVNLPFLPEPVSVPVFTDIGTLGGFAIGQVARTPGVGLALSGIDVGDSGRISANIRALIEQGEAEIRTRPIVASLNKRPAKIETVEEVPFQDVQFHPKTGAAQLRVDFEKVGVKLHVTPTIIEPVSQNIIQLDLTKIEISGVSSFITIREVQRPVFITSEANTKVNLRNGESLVVGGLKTKRKVITENRVPILGRIPILGWLFKNERVEIRDRDILFFVTPYLLPPGVNPIIPYDFKNNQVLTNQGT